MAGLTTRIERRTISRASVLLTTGRTDLAGASAAGRTRLSIAALCAPASATPRATGAQRPAYSTRPEAGSSRGTGGDPEARGFHSGGNDSTLGSRLDAVRWLSSIAGKLPLFAPRIFRFVSGFKPLAPHIKR
jgi:hypothetical protein